MSTGRVNPAHRLEHQGISDLGQVHYNLLEPALIQAALTRNEGRLGNGGTLLVSTGKYTGRSPVSVFPVPQCKAGKSPESLFYAFCKCNHLANSPN